MGVKGHGTTIGYGATVAGPHTAIAKVEKVTPGAVSVDDIESTNMDSADEYKEYLAGRKDAGDGTISVQYEKVQSTAINALIAETKNWKITFKDGSTWTCDGYIKGLGTPVEENGLVRTELTIKFSGKPVVTATPPG
jgi:hypothetical protein